MGTTTGISWTDHTQNPWLGCQKVSPACENCYAEVSPPIRTNRANGLELWGPPSTTPRLRTGVKNWNLPLRWNRAAEKAGRRAQVFCASLSDVFEDHPMLPPWRADLWKLIEQTPWLNWQLLTKRPQNILSMIPRAWVETPRDNVWYGTTVEDQRRADERIPELLRVPGIVRFLSMEPLVSPVDITRYMGGPSCIDWAIIGGESGPAARPFNLDWARSLIAQCRTEAVVIWLKQLGSRPELTPGPIAWPITDSHGSDQSEWPADLRVQQFPPNALYGGLDDQP